MAAFLNPLIEKYLQSLIRDGLKALGLVLVTRELTTEADVAAIIPGLATFLAGLIWSLWERRDSLRKINTALSLPAGTTPLQLIQTIRRDGPVPADLPTNVSPIAPAVFKAQHKKE